MKKTLQSEDISFDMQNCVRFNTDSLKPWFVVVCKMKESNVYSFVCICLEMAGFPEQQRTGPFQERHCVFENVSL